MNIMGVTGEFLRSSLDASVLRQSIGATNIANASRPGFIPFQVSFDESMRDAVREYRQTGKVDIPKPRVVESEPQVGNEIGGRTRVDSEAAALVANAIRYQATIGGLRGYTEILQIAINDGKR